MTESDNPPSKPISVAELLAKNGSIGSPPVGGRRRRRRGDTDSISVAELTGEIPIFSDEPAGTGEITFGTGDIHDEHPADAPNLVDSLASTTWSTEGYTAKVLPKPGVGVYIDAKPSVKASRIEIQSVTPGWEGAIYVAPNGGVPQTLPGSGWVKSATITDAPKKLRVPASSFRGPTICLNPRATTR